MLAQIDAANNSSNTETEDLDRYLAWLKDFKSKRGRPLRVLHIGNIANNAYLNAKFLRSVGVDAYVVSYNYQHVMATPEWEDVELTHGHGDDFAPNFSWRDLRGYHRPVWFVSGPLTYCIYKVSILFGDTPLVMRIRFYILGQFTTIVARLFGANVGHGIQFLLFSRRVFVHKFLDILRKRYRHNRVMRFFWHYILLLKDRIRNPHHSLEEGSAVNALIADFKKAFPQRKDRLTYNDIAPYEAMNSHFRDMFRHYDIIQCYGTEPIHALISGKHPYVAFEHGTLRTFTMSDSPLHRLTALAYRNADHTFITNGDCLEYAEKLGLTNYSPIVHPVDVEQYRQDLGDTISSIRSDIGAEVILFCPVRHDWAVKATDIHLRALPMIKECLQQKTVKLILIRWGQELRQSQDLISAIGCEDDVVWRSSMCRQTMIKYLRSADVVLDQMALPHFGATAPQSIAAGTPVISSYDPESTKWIIPEPAPILSAFTPKEVSEAVIQALDPDWRADYQRRAKYWIDRYHHPRNIIHEHLRIYRRLVENE